MPQIPFPLGFEGSKDLPETNKILQNLMNIGENRILGRDGISGLNTVPGKVARGNFEWNGNLYMVFSTSLIKITDVDTGAFDTILGIISGPEAIQTAIGFNDAAIVSPGIATYALGKPDVLTAITSVTDNGGIARFNYTGDVLPVPSTVTISGFTSNPSYNVTGIITAAGSTFFEISSVAFGTNETGSFAVLLRDISNNSNFVPYVDVVHIDQRFIFIPSDGDPAQFTDVGDIGTIQATSFFDAEVLPDKNNGVFTLGNTLYITGTNSIEAYQNTGATPNPFSRIPGALIENGLLGGLLDYTTTQLFIGKKKNNVAGIFAVAPGGATRISNERIDRLLSTYTEAELGEAIPGRIIQDGYDIATFALRRDSFGFLNGNWFILDTVFSGDSKPWGAGFIAQFEGSYFTAFEDNIGKFADINTDYGNRITRIIGGGATNQEGDYITVGAMTLGLSQGFNSGIGSVALRTSDTNVQFGPEIYRNLGDIGQYDRKLRWNPPGGLGTYLGFFGYQIYTTEDVKMSADQLIMDFF